MIYLALSCPHLHLIIELSRHSRDSLLLSYNPQSPTDEKEGITESCELWVRDVVKARQIRGEIYRLFHSGGDNYLLMRTDSASEIWRSKIIKGAVTWGDEALGGRSVTLLVSWERCGYWDGEIRELPLSNAHGERVVGGIMVDLHSDSSHNNWVEIAARDAITDVSCPYIAHISYTGYSVEEIYLAYISLRGREGYFPDLTLQSEHAFPLVPGKLINSSQASGGIYWQCELKAGAQAQKILDWRLNNNQTIQLAGKTTYFLLKGHGAILANVEFFVSLYVNGQQIRRTESITSSGSRAVLNLGGFKLPHTKKSLRLRGIRIILNAYSSTGGTLNIDALGLLPGFRNLKPYTNGLMSSEILIDDGLKDELYKTDKTANNPQCVLNYFGIGRRANLQPHTDQRIYIASRAILGKFNLKLFYRPRHI